MKKTLEKEIALICYAYVSSNFANFCNPKNQGSNFKWENFADMQKKRMKTQIWLQMNMPENQAEQVAIENKAMLFANEIATTLVKESEFVNSNENKNTNKVAI